MAALLCYLHSCCFNLGERRLHGRYHFTLASPSHDTLTPLPYANEDNEMTTTIGALLVLAGLGFARALCPAAPGLSAALHRHGAQLAPATAQGPRQRGRKPAL